MGEKSVKKEFYIQKNFLSKWRWNKKFPGKQHLTESISGRLILKEIPKEFLKAESDTRQYEFRWKNKELW